MQSLHLLIRKCTGEFVERRFDVERLEIGREATADVVLDELSVSRHHALLERVGEATILRDVGSQGGTRLNGAGIEGEATVTVGDVVQVGDTTILVCGSAPTADDEQRLRSWTAPSPVSAMDFDKTRIVYAEAASTHRGAPAPSQSAVFEAMSRSLQTARSLDDILTVLLGIAFDTVAPERGAILLKDRASESLKTRVSHPESADDFVSTTILNHAIQERSVLVVGDVALDVRFRQAPSLLAHDVQAVICCPLISRDEIVGAMYLDASLAELLRPEEQIGLLNFVAGYAATAIENAMLMEERARARTLADLDEQPMIAQSGAMQGLLRELEAFSMSPDPLWIEGGRGTGKLLVARHAHVNGASRQAPFLAVDCARLSGRDFHELIQGREGVAPGIWDQTRGGTLVLEHLDALDLLAQNALLERIQDSDRSRAPRIIATSAMTLAEFARGSTRLGSFFGDRTVRVPLLKERKEDILPLARAFVAQAAREKDMPSVELGSSAEATIVAARYREANVSELREAIDLGVVLSGGRAIEAEHVFTGPRSRPHRLEFDLASSKLVRWMLGRNVQNFMSWITVCVFVALIVVCLGWPDSAAGHVANDIVWGLWWPVLLLVFLAVGRLWCTYCPLSRLARWGQKLLGPTRKPPAWVKSRAHWVMAALFLVIVWSEHVFAMPEHPAATGVFLLTLIAAAFAAAAFTKGEIWCRFACPLGNMSACYSTSATVHVHANPMICQTQCRTHECYKGSDAEAGCSMFLHPLYVKDSHFCKLCMACVRNCPNNSAKLWMRPPLQDLWSLAELNPQLVPLALTLFLLAPLLLAGPREFLPFTALALGLFALVWPLWKGIERLVGVPDDGMPPVRVAFALSLVAWGPLMAFHLKNVPALERLFVSSRDASTAAAGWQLLPLLQLLAVFGAACAGFAVLGRIRGERRGRGWWVVQALGILHVAVSARLVL